MTVTAPTYEAFLTGTPDYPLSIRRGSVRLDESTSPHINVTLDVTNPSESVMVALDPRQRKRVRLRVIDGVLTRWFDLALRARRRGILDAYATLELASDEALLNDYVSTFEDDKFIQGGSLRTIINAVLFDVFGAGTALQASPSVDADVTPYWRVTNLITNSSFEFDVAGWKNGSRADGLAPYTGGVAYAGTKSGHWRTTAAGWSFIDSDPISVGQGQDYNLSAYMRNVDNGSARNARVLIRWFNQRGTALRDDYGAVVSVSNSFKRVIAFGRSPAGAVNATVHIGFEADAANRFPAVDGVMFIPGSIVVPFFDGLTPDDANYTYTYSDETLQQGTSTRTPVVTRDPQALYWRTGQSARDFIMTLVQSKGLRLVCDEQRRWTLRDENYTAPGQIQIRHGVNLVDGSDNIDRDSGLWYDAALTIYTWTDRDGIQQRMVDAYLPTGYTRPEVFQRDTAYPGPGFSAYATRRAAGRGREVTVTSVADWAASAEQITTAIIEGAPPQVGRSRSITFDLDTNRMTVITRATDTPIGAIDLLGGTIDDLPRTIDTL